MRLAAPPTIPPVKKAAPVDAIGVIELFGATLLITNVIKLPAPMPLTTSPIIPVFKLEPIPLPIEDDLLRIDVDLRLTIGFLIVVRLLTFAVIRLLVGVFRLVLVVDREPLFVFFFLNPPLFIICENLLLAASCFLVASYKTPKG